MALRFFSYLWREFVPLFFVFIVILLLMVTINLVAYTLGWFISNHASVGQFIEFWLSQLPYNLSYIAPPALAIAVLIGLSRLSKDSELKAVFSAGVQPIRLIGPIALFSLLVGLASFYNTNFVVPAAQRSQNAVLNKIRNQPDIVRQDLKSFASEDGRTLYFVGSYTPKVGNPNLADLSGAMIVDGQGTWTATQGTWDANAKTWELTNVNFTPLGGQEISSHQVRRVFPFRFALEPDARPSDQLSLSELLERVRHPVGALQEQYQDLFKLNSRFSEPFACLIFALVAGSIGLTVRDRGMAFGSVILAIAAYWVLWNLLGKSLAGAQATPAWFAAWLPVMVFGVGFAFVSKRLT